MTRPTWMLFGIAISLACTTPEKALLSVSDQLATAEAYAMLPAVRLDSVISPCADSEDCIAAGTTAATDSAGGVAFLGLRGKVRQVYLIRPGDPAPRALGREGAGPGEYRGVYRLGLSQDGDLLVWDLGFRRLLRYATAGGDTATAQLPMPPSVLYGALVGGRVLVLGTEIAARSGDSARVVLYELKAGAEKPFTVSRLDLRQPSWRLDDMRPAPSALDPKPSWAVAPDGSVLFSSGSSFSVSRFTPDGAEAARFGFDVSSRSTEGSDRSDAAATAKTAVRGISDPRMREAAAAQSGRRTPSRLPAISALVAASDGSTWVREWPSAPLDSVSWVRFDAGNSPVHRLVLGSNDALIDSRGDRILFTRAANARDPDILYWARIRTTGAP